MVSYRRIRRQRHLTGSCDKVVPIMNQVGVIGPTNAALIERTSGLELGSLEAVARRIGFLLASKGTAMVCVPDRGVGLWALDAYFHAGVAIPVLQRNDVVPVNLVRM